MKKLFSIAFIVITSLIAIPVTFGQCSHAHKAFTRTSSISPDFSDSEYKYDVGYYYIDLKVSNTDTYIEGFTQISLLALEEIDTLVFEFNSYLNIDSISVSSFDNIQYIHEANLIYITFDGIIQSGENQTVIIYYKGTSQGSGFFAGMSNKTDHTWNQDVTYTLSEPFQASSWFPVKQDLQDKADSVRVHITVDNNLMAGSNGILENIRDLGNNKKRFEWFSEYPIAYYLISITVADYIDYSFYVDISGAESPLLVQNFIYNSPNILAEQKENIHETEALLQLFSELFGIYPFIDEKYGHCMAPLGGGMEHQTMTTLQNFNFELVAHELAHQWFGDYVTCSSWQDIWINEGFASYAEYLSLEFIKGEEAAIEWMAEAHDLALNAKTGSIYLSGEETSDPSRIFSLYLSYKKGASILNMLRYEINQDETFFNILKSFISQYKNSLASADDFLEVVNEISGENYSWFFDQWYYGEGYPTFQISYRSLGDSLYLVSNQKGVENPSSFYKTHFDIKIYFENGRDTLIRLFQEEASESLTIPIDQKVTSVQFDPYSRILSTSIVFEFLLDKGEIEILPNPFQDYLNIGFSDVSSKKEIIINDIKGNIVLQEQFPPSSSQTLDLNLLESGIYILTLRISDTKISKKIIKL